MRQRPLGLGRLVIQFPGHHYYELTPGERVRGYMLDEQLEVVELDNLYGQGRRMVAWHIHCWRIRASVSQGSDFLDDVGEDMEIV